MNSRTLWWVLTLLLMALGVGLTASELGGGAYTQKLLKQLIHADVHTYEALHRIVRKGAHAVLYSLLGILAWQALRRWPSPRYLGLWAWGVVTLYGLVDELHQMLVPDRTGKLTDVLLDSASAGAAILLVSLAEALWRAYRARRTA